MNHYEKKRSFKTLQRAAKKKNTPITKIFGAWVKKEDGSKLLCQIARCSQRANWLVSIGDETVAMCFDHGEELTQ